MYKLQSLKRIKAGINRHLKESRNIIADVHFSKADEMFKGVSKERRINGKGSTKSYKEINQANVSKLEIITL